MQRLRTIVAYLARNRVKVSLGAFLIIALLTSMHPTVAYAGNFGDSPFEEQVSYLASALRLQYRIGRHGNAGKPGLWLAHVCEPFGGFSKDDNITFDSHEREAPLQASSSRRGPWHTVVNGGPPWILTDDEMDGIASGVNATNYRRVWLRAGPMGRPTLVQSAIVDRNWIMSDLCNP